MAKDEYNGPPLRTGTWGSRAKECAHIEAFKRHAGQLHGPYTVDYLPGNMYKIMYSPTECHLRVCDGHDFLRYADEGQLEEMYEALRRNDDALFLRLAHNHAARIQDGKRRANGEIDKGWGGEDDVCKWIEAHDEVFVNYAGHDPVWPNGCWEVVSRNDTRQLLDRDQLYYVAQKILGMGNGSAPFKQVARAAKAFVKAQQSAAQSIEDLFGVMAEQPEDDDPFGLDDDDDILAAFDDVAQPETDDIDALFA